MIVDYMHDGLSRRRSPCLYRLMTASLASNYSKQKCTKTTLGPSVRTVLHVSSGILGRKCTLPRRVLPPGESR